MSFSDIAQNALEERLKFAWRVLRERGKEGAYTRQIAPQILGVPNPTKEQARALGMTMKAMASRGMIEVAEERKHKKDAVKWRAVDHKKWRAINANAFKSSKFEADYEQNQWYDSVVSEYRMKRQFRAKMADRL